MADSTGTNIYLHTSDAASTTTIDNSKTVFSSDNVQDALGEIASHALQEITDYTTATTSNEGVVTIASDSDYSSDTTSTNVVTPEGLNYWLANYSEATESSYGLIELVSDDDLSDATDDSKALTIAKFNDYTSIRVATESTPGFLKIATDDMMDEASDDASIVTPAKAKEAITYWAITSDTQASTTEAGMIRIATSTESAAGSDNTIAMTPSNLNDRAATTSIRGAFMIPTSTVAEARSSDDYAVTVGTLDLFEATDSLMGVAKLYDGLDSTATDTALTANQGYELDQNKIGADGGTVTGTLILNNIENSSGTALMTDGEMTAAAMLGMYPVGSIYMSINSTNPGSIFGGTWSQVAQGKVIIGAGTGTDDNSVSETFTSGSTGGEYTHTLTTDEIPEHQHLGMGMNDSPGSWKYGYLNSLSYYGTHNPDSTTYPFYTSPVGGDEGHNNLQPYLVCYIFERTA